MKPKGQIQYFKSNIDGKMSPYAVCATHIGEEPKPLILEVSEVSPEAHGNLNQCIKTVENIAGIAVLHDKPCVVLRPTARGNGTVYQHYGEMDLFEALAHVKKSYTIDEKRISITGASMGGAATWYLISHYPDVFSAAAPFCGYCDYRLWEKPGGPTFPMREWEEPSWLSRSAPFLIENLRYTPVWMIHGEWDRAIGTGVCVEQSRQMARLFTERDYPFQYTELPRTGHDCRTPKLLDKVVPWLLDQKKVRYPKQVRHAAYTLRHNRSHWVAIEQIETYGAKALVDACLQDYGTVTIQTENVRALALSPIKGQGQAVVDIDGTAFENIGLGHKSLYRKNAEGQWETGQPNFSGGKHRGVSGPIGDLFFEGVLLVPGTNGSDFESAITKTMARDAVRHYASRNGGVNRGGILGDTDFELPVCPDRELAEEDRRGNNLILYGTPSSNRVLNQFKDLLPIAFDEGCLTLRGKEYPGDAVAAFALFPHPENPARYVAVHGGTTPDAISWGSHFDMHLLPDYLVYAKGKLLDWGFWDSEWEWEERRKA